MQREVLEASSDLANRSKRFGMDDLYFKFTVLFEDSEKLGTATIEATTYLRPLATASKKECRLSSMQDMRGT